MNSPGRQRTRVSHYPTRRVPPPQVAGGAGHDSPPPRADDEVACEGCGMSLSEESGDVFYSSEGKLCNDCFQQTEEYAAERGSDS